ncbi:MAG: dihydrodipicolinate synthase family protein [Sphaerochaeta sp.]|jgi:4-hydroxy-tetrahydrodipicolinate synthase|nr:dihydrodipicolinate synthase family protein [Sphaerochaeta sp.]PKL25964.1 MAG: dihydrodipicolinate synthase family protein [Spirochaetae bacterium HGW-Spirochaetae-2]PKM75853.1 MAG: dihydrodipicolinate synthase family protein [Firmicutes bacterium HGW-Firmicutes-15]
MKKLAGVVTAVPTMIDSNLTVRKDWMESLIKHILAGKVDGLYPCGTTGEMLYLSINERKLIAETVVKTRNDVKSDAVVYIHAGAARVEDTVELIQHAQAIGADGAGVVTPWYYKLDDQALFEFYDRVFSQVSSSFPLYVYNIPQLSGNDLKPSSIRDLKAKYSNLLGVKYSFSDFNRLKEYVALEGIEVLIGADVQMVESMIVGAVGTISGLSSVYPTLFSEIYRLFKAGSISEAMKLETYAYELGCIMKHGGNLSMFKAALALRGLPESIVKPPLRNMTSDEKHAFLNTLEQWSERLNQNYPLLLQG